MSSLRLIFKLALLQLASRPARLAMALSAIVASVSSLVWIASGYDALASRFDEDAKQYLGRYHLLVLPTPEAGSRKEIDGALVELLRQDPNVAELDSAVHSRISVTTASEDQDQAKGPLDLLVGSRPPVIGAPPIEPILVGSDSPFPPYELIQGRWLDDGAEDRSETVLSKGAAHSLRVTVGDEIVVTSVANQRRLRVVGIVDQAPELSQLAPSSAAESNHPPSAAMAAPVELATGKEALNQEQKFGIPQPYVPGVASSAIYVRKNEATQINGFALGPNVLRIALRDEQSLEAFHQCWDQYLQRAIPPLWIADLKAVRNELQSHESIGPQQMQAYAAAGMASLAAVFIISATLSMDVNERARELALLRAVALSRMQLVGIVVIESVLLAIAGWTGGLLAGWILLLARSGWTPDSAYSEAIVGWNSVMLSGMTVLLGAFAAALWPAWRVTRIRPLDAMSRQGAQVFKISPLKCFFLGVVFLAITPATVFIAPLPDHWRVWCYAFACYPLMILGVVLLTPAAVLCCERPLSPLLARCLGVSHMLLKTQLSSNMRRTVGATLSLTVGLSLFAATQIWGHSMLQPFLPGSWAPDALVAFHPLGLKDEDFQLVKRVPGVVPNDVMSLAVEQARFVWEGSSAPPRLRSDNAVLIGVEPQRALMGDAPLLRMTFTEGDRDSAAAKLAEAGGCLITEDFALLAGLHLADKLQFAPPNAPDQKITFEIAGVVRAPGWPWITKFSGIRRHFVRTGAMIFASRKDVQRHFHLGRTEFFWLNLDDHIPRSSIEAKLQQIAELDSGQTFTSDDAQVVTAHRPFARLTLTSDVRQAIGILANEVIWSMSQLPLVTLAIMSLAMANAMAASVRARTWEFGVLRAVGVSRGQLVRLIMAEGMLIGVTACLLSITFGLLAGWCGAGMALYLGGHYAGPSAFAVPWVELSTGFAATLALCSLAAIWPALKIGLSEPLALLQRDPASP